MATIQNIDMITVVFVLYNYNIIQYNIIFKKNYCYCTVSVITSLGNKHDNTTDLMEVLYDIKKRLLL